MKHLMAQIAYYSAAIAGTGVGFVDALDPKSKPLDVCLGLLLLFLGLLLFLSLVSSEPEREEK